MSLSEEEEKKSSQNEIVGIIVDTVKGENKVVDIGEGDAEEGDAAEGDGEGYGLVL